MIKINTQPIWLCIAFILLALSAFAQKNYVPGYLVLPPGDTVRGLIDDQNWERNPTAINFKKEINANSQKFTVAQIEGFGVVDGDIYHKKIVKVDKTPTQLEELSRTVGNVITTDTVFLAEQVRGPINLYYLHDENRKNHFYIQIEDGTVEELIQRSYLVNKSGQNLLGISDQYKDQLRYSYLISCPNLHSEINKTTYTKASLKSLIYKYNACLNPAILVEQKPTAKEEYKFNLVAGLDGTSYTFKGDPYSFKDLVNAKFDLKPSIMMGLGFQILLPRNRHKWSLYNEVAYKKNYAQGHSQNQQYYRNEQSKITIKADYVGFTTMLRYSWLKQNYQPFVNIGFAGNYALQISTHKQTIMSTSSEAITREATILKDSKKVEVAAVAGAGVKIKKITAELRLEKGSGYLNYTNLSVTKNMLAFLLGYNFN
ncbi:outer membrane beta-barrel protein [Adhaeribacter pallidiroseus]|uniref:Outer membrane protein beta-barrel domain-containing protein n=1 Tax=Adhaeribacter pallidiroseus TaxID=2072847 RepID=A0A369QH48_9BACT|nr:outer membrane beta-barrel protein [Adhaeribacter pallidiroseus]RDC62587.1 hypothetical protein AHMF7616_01181 [Adhaeribacter pallidiroseus]